MMTEAERMAALRELDLLDTPGEKEYDDLTLLASAACSTPISLISLLDENRQWFKSVIGLEDREAPRNLSFCTHAMQQSGLFIVEDAMDDPRFASNPYVTGELHLRFYAAVPLHAPGGAVVGALCVIDIVPRQLQERQKQALMILAQRVENEMSLRLAHKFLKKELRTQQRVRSTLTAASDLFFSFMKHGPFASYIKEANGEMVFYNKYLADTNGVSEEEWIGLKDEEIWPEAMAAKFRRNDVEVLEKNQPMEHQDFSPTPDGCCIIWKTIKFPYVTNGGRRMLAGISMDITAEVLREAQLENALRDRDEALRKAGCGVDAESGPADLQ